ncbi:hypothetical protein [Novosphingobium sp. B1]|uniref:hypothetical protein n=1 Tax=Novosphingobium sp. B1 TaxID=1938756 RepID=UPI0009D8DDC6|nr:hypothetical protein [Novosphingobium sp. B1]SMC97137.1 hypothetical protein SAMN06272759_11512 [Novosphingobium sp. B1]
MPDFYSEMADVARDILAPTDQDGLGQGTIALVRYTSQTEFEPWELPAPPSREVTPLNGAARGVGKELIGAPVENGGQIVSNDLTVIVAPWGGEVEPGQVLELDGKPVTILKVESIPAVGTTCAVRFVVRR